MFSSRFSVINLKFRSRLLKVDQTFIILGKIILLKHNLPKLLIKSKKPSVELTALGFKYKFTFSPLSAQLLFQS